jgi:arabinofuranan 3-O-arabinosyltransferase
MTASIRSDRRAAPESTGGDRDVRNPPPKPPPEQRISWSRHLVLAVVAYVPLLLTAPGSVAADTKTYLYLDPGRLLERAPSMWDLNIGLGTVTHQNIGYLWPMGPWYWLFETLGAPDWVAQRLWLGTLMFAAGAGVLYLLRTLRWRGAGMLAAAAIYMLSPYVLHYGARISVLLLPWAGLPWMIGLTQRAVRSGGWRHPAIFALVTATVGGVNATALVLAGLGPLLWLPFSVLVHREATGAQAFRAALRIGLLTVICSLWWVAGLAVQGSFGIDILRYTETVETVARTSLASEVLRGLGYWFFYGGDLLGPWIEPGRHYTQFLPLILIGFSIPAMAFFASVSLRWRYRAYFVFLIVVATTAAVGAYPYTNPSPLGSAFKELATTSTIGLALRSTPRAVPLVILSMAVLIGAGLSALSARTNRRAVIGSVLVIAVAVAGLPPLWIGQMIGGNLQRPEEIPTHWPEAASWLDERDHDTRVLVLPGSDFASYRWGNTVDPVLPGLMDRPMVARELIPYGSPPSADLLIALDRRIQEGVFESAALAPMARILGAGDVLLRSDLQWERYRTPRPRDLWDRMNPPPPGLEEPVAFGAPEPNEPPIERGRQSPLVDEVTLAIPPGTPNPPPVAVFPVEDPQPMVRVEPGNRTLILAGDGEGVVEAAATGLLDDPGVVLYEADLATDPEARARAIEAGADLVLTDTNRRRQRRWSSVRENAGMTEVAGEEALRPVVDQRLPVFPEETDASKSVVEWNGVRRIQSTGYGNHITYTPDDRAGLAFDGDLETAWTVGAFGGIVGHRLEVELEEEVTTDRVRLTQPLTGEPNRWITRVEVVLDGRTVGDFPLGDESRRRGGQEIVFGDQTFRTMALVISGDSAIETERQGASSVGFSEVEIDGVRAEEIVRLPTALLGDLGVESAQHDLTVLLARMRSDPRELYRTDEEPSLIRSLTLPTARQFELTGTARLSARADGSVIDELTGRGTVMTAQSSRRLVGDVRYRASSAFDGDPETAWRTPVGLWEGEWVELQAESPVTVDELALQVVTDGRHSVPTRLGIVADGERVGSVDVPDLADLPEENATTSVALEVPELTASTIRLVIEAVRVIEGTDSFSLVDQTLPVGIAEVGLPTQFTPAPQTFDTGCRDDLVTVDGRPVSIRVQGETDAAEQGRPLAVETCGPDAGGLDLDPGEHVLRTARGRDVGIDLDRLVLTSTVTDRAAGDAAAAAGTPELRVAGAGRTSFDLEVSGATEPFWLVLGQSHNAGWQLTSDELGDLGEQRIADGYANGWWIDPGDRGSFTLALDWTPQRSVWTALALSALGAVLCLVLAVIGRRWLRVPDERIGIGFQHPQLISPVRGVGVRPPPRTIAVLTVVLGLTAALLLAPWAGVLVAAAAGVALFWRQGRLVLTAGAVGLIGLACLAVIFRQIRWDFAPDFGWPEHFYPSHVMAWIAILFLLADVVVGWARRRTEVL